MDITKMDAHLRHAFNSETAESAEFPIVLHADAGHDALEAVLRCDGITVRASPDGGYRTRVTRSTLAVLSSRDWVLAVLFDVKG